MSEIELPPEYDGKPSFKLEDIYKSKLKAATHAFVALRKAEMDRHAKEMQRLDQAQREAEREMEQAMLTALRGCEIKKGWFW